MLVVGGVILSRRLTTRKRDLLRLTHRVDKKEWGIDGHKEMEGVLSSSRSGQSGPQAEGPSDLQTFQRQIETVQLAK